MKRILKSRMFLLCFLLLVLSGLGYGSMSIIKTSEEEEISSSALTLSDELQTGLKYSDYILGPRSGFQPHSSNKNTVNVTGNVKEKNYLNSSSDGQVMDFNSPNEPTADWFLYLNGTYSGTSKQSVSGSGTFYFEDAATSVTGKKYDVEMTISDIHIKLKNAGEQVTNPVIAMTTEATNNNEGGYLRLCAVRQKNTNNDGIFGVEIKVTYKIVDSDDSDKVFCVYDDLDQPGLTGTYDGYYSQYQEGIIPSSDATHKKKGSNITVDDGGYYGKCESTANTDDTNVISFVDSAKKHSIIWTGTNCATFMGTSLSLLQTANPVSVYIRVQDSNGDWSDYEEVSGSNKKIYVGAYFTWSWSRSTIYPSNIYGEIENGEDVDSESGVVQVKNALSSGSIKYQITQAKEYKFYVQVPRLQCTYTFDYDTYNIAGSSNVKTKYNNTDSKTNGSGAQTYTWYVESDSPGYPSPVPKSEIDGYVFLGYYEASHIHGPVTIDGINMYTVDEAYAYTSEQMPYDKTWYAVWRPIIYYVNFVGNTYDFDHETGEYTQQSISGSMTKMTCYFGANYSLTSNGYSREGYQFTGWTTHVNGASWTREHECNVDGSSSGMGSNICTHYISNGNMIHGKDPTGGTYDSFDASRLSNDTKDIYANCHSFKNWGYEDQQNIYIYAAWKKCYGSEQIYCVSEETNAGLPGVKMKLQKKVNNEWVDVPGMNDFTSGTNGLISISGGFSGGLHWFDYRWVMTKMPAGYYTNEETPSDCYASPSSYPYTNFTIKPGGKCTADHCWEVTSSYTVGLPVSEGNYLNAMTSYCLDSRHRVIVYMKHVDIRIYSSVDCIINKEDPPAFLYHISGLDAAGIEHNYNVLVQTGLETLNGMADVNESSNFPKIFAGTYKITQTPVSRYTAQTAKNVSNATINGTEATVDVLNNERAVVSFPYKLTNHGWWYGVDSKKNSLLLTQ